MTLGSNNHKIQQPEELSLNELTEKFNNFQNKKIDAEEALLGVLQPQERSKLKKKQERYENIVKEIKELIDSKSNELLQNIDKNISQLPLFMIPKDYVINPTKQHLISIRQLFASEKRIINGLHAKGIDNLCQLLDIYHQQGYKGILEIPHINIKSLHIMKRILKDNGIDIFVPTTSLKEEPRSLTDIATTILQHIIDNRELLKYTIGVTKRGKEKITIENISNLAGNHLFDDYPWLFGITKLEGDTFREYFQERAKRKTILEIRDQLFYLFDEENPEFIERLE
ncbi:MAG: hypothetical protein WC875_03155 [Candidatus Absconditabacterales bacterium]